MNEETVETTEVETTSDNSFQTEMARKVACAIAAYAAVEVAKVLQKKVVAWNRNRKSSKVLTIVPDESK